MKHQRATIKQRIAEGIRNKQMGGKEEPESHPSRDLLYALSLLLGIAVLFLLFWLLEG
jgi:hypothetical protein